MDERPGDPVPGLTSWQRLGRGGFGTVYLARDEDHARTVAVKLLSTPDLDERAQRTFQRERQAMGMLSGHPNIVVVYRSGLTSEGRPFIVMDHMAGGSLADVLTRDGAMPWEQATAAAVKIAGALEAAHRLGVLHRDVKPANILLTAWGEPKLGDFGIAQMATATGSSTGTTSASVAHAPPEVLDGKPATPASDVYSLGSTLFALIAGDAPFVRPGDDSLLPILARVLADPPPDLRQHGTPDALAVLVERALAKDPDDRFPSAAAFGTALQQVLAAAGHPVPPMLTDVTAAGGTSPSIGGSAAGGVAPAPDSRVTLPQHQAGRGRPQHTPPPDTPAPDGPPPDTPAPDGPPADTTPAGRPDEDGVKGWLVPVVVAALLLLGILAVLAVTGDDTAPAEDDPPADESAPADPGSVADLPGAIAYRTDSGDGALSLGIIDPGADPELYPDLGEIGRPALAPDGQRVAYVHAGALRTYDRQTGEQAVILEQEVRDPTWSPDGQQIAYAAVVDGQQDLYVIDIRGGEPVQVTDTPATEGSPTWSPDGAVLAHDSDEGGDFDIWLVGVDGSDRRQLTSGPGSDETPAYHPSADELVFVRRAADGSAELMHVPADGSGDPRPLDLGGLEPLGPSYSPDGRHVVLATPVGEDDLDLVVVELTTRAVRQLVVAPGLQVDPYWNG